MRAKMRRIDDPSQRSVASFFERGSNTNPRQSPELDAELTASGVESEATCQPSCSNPQSAEDRNSKRASISIYRPISMPRQQLQPVSECSFHVSPTITPSTFTTLGRPSSSVSRSPSIPFSSVCVTTPKTPSSAANNITPGPLSSGVCLTIGRLSSTASIMPGRMPPYVSITPASPSSSVSITLESPSSGASAQPESPFSSPIFGRPSSSSGRLPSRVTLTPRQQSSDGCSTPEAASPVYVSILARSSSQCSSATESPTNLSSRKNYTASPHPGRNRPTAANVHVQKVTGRNLRYNNSWSDEYVWLHWKDNKLVCYYCSEVDPKSNLPDMNQCDEAFISKGFSNWKNGPARFITHENSKGYGESLRIVSSRSDPTVTAAISFSHRTYQNKSKSCLSVIVSSLKYCGRQGIAIRGSDHDDGNFIQYLSVL